MLRWVAVLLLLAAVAVAAEAAPKKAPHVMISASGVVEVTLPASVLDAAHDQNLLDTGLTTAIITTLRTRSRGAAVRSTVRVELRFDLWDESYVATVLDASGTPRRQTFPTYERLHAWWSGARIHAATLPANEKPKNVSIRTEVVPFSAMEELDAQRWLAHSVGERPAADGEGTKSSGLTIDSFLDLFIGTSVQRRPVLVWKWTVGVQR